MNRGARKIVLIDEEKCDGCGVCVPGCAEGAIQVIDGKARLVSENLCDGLGNCLGTCPRGAITIEERPADEFDEAAVAAHLTAIASPPMPCGCPGSQARILAPPARAAQPTDARASQLGHWPVQLHLVPTQGQIWQDADVLIAADCVGFAMPDFHERLLSGKTLAVGCPKLDDTAPYVQKLATIFAGNAIRSVTVALMEVPCCTGLVMVVQQALSLAKRTDIPMRDLVIGVDGSIKFDAQAAVS